MRSTVVQCSLHHVSSHEQTVSSVLCNCAETFFFFFFCATYAFVRSFFSFFFLSFFFYFIFFPPLLCDECLWADRETQSRCLRKIFFFFLFFLVGKHQVPIFETNKSSIESMFKARCRRTNDRVISDRWRCAIRQLYIRSCSASNPIFLRSERARRRRIYGRFFFFFFFPPSDFWKQLTTAGILIYSTVKVIFQCFDTKIEFLGIKLIRLWIIISQECVELHNAIESKSHNNTLYTAVVLRLKTGSYNSISCDDKNI